MPAPRLSDEVLKQAAEAYKRHGTNGNRELGIPRSTFEARVTAAINRGFCTRDDRRVLAPVEVATATPFADEAMLRDQVRTLRAQLASATRSSITDEIVRREIIKLAEAPVEVPDWTIKAPKRHTGVTGVPVLFASDLHWGEVVYPSQVNGANEFNIEIAHARLRRMVETATTLLKRHMVSPSYPGIVFVLGGDLVSGSIHEELSESNELDIMPTVIDLIGELRHAIELLADEFGRVFVPCVSGNHGRNTKKMRAKNRNFSNFDWLICMQLAKWFERDERVRFLVPDGPDAFFNIYNTRVYLTHGDSFRSFGDSLIGSLGPVIRGNHKKLGRNTAIGRPHDLLMLGHFHQLTMLERIVINGSLKGFDEWAYTCGFGFEVAQQALFVIHPEHGRTFSMPVRLQDPPKGKATEWLSWAK